MELNKTYCKDCGHTNRWYSYKWIGGDASRAEHNRVNNTTCPKCGSHNVSNVEDDETMGPYRAMASVLTGRDAKG